MNIHRTALLVSFALLLSSCGQDIKFAASTPPKGNAAAFADARLVPLSIGQAMAVKNGIVTGQITSLNVDDVSVATALIEDLDGQPFYYLTLTTSGLGASPNFWDAVNSIEGNRSDSLIATGASTARTLYAFEYDATTTRDLKATARRAGSVKRLVIPDGGVLWLQDQQGRYWSVADQRQLTAPQIQAAHRVYAGLVQRYLEDKQSMQVGWDAVLDDPEVGPLALSSSTARTQGIASGLQRFVRRDGTLNVAAVVHDLPASAVHAQMSDKGGPIKMQLTDDVSGRGFLNRVTSYAGIAGSTMNGYSSMAVSDMSTNADWLYMKKTDWGNRQSAQGEVGQVLGAGQSWGLRSAFSPATAVAPAGHDLIGCMATSYARLFATLVQQNYKLTFAATNAGLFNISDPVPIQIQKSIAHLTKPVQADGMPTGTVEPYITQRMGGGFFGGGTLITPPGLANGGAAVFNEKISSLGTGLDLGLRFDGWGFMDPTGNSGIAVGSNPATYWGYTSSAAVARQAGFNAGTIYARDVVRRTMRDSHLPVMFLYSTGNTLGLAGHAAVSGAYRSYEYAGGYSDVFVYTAPDTSPTDASQSIYPENGSGNRYPGFGEGVQGPTGWINVTNRWSAYGGVFALGPKWQW